MSIAALKRELGMTIAERLPDHLHPLLVNLRENPSAVDRFWATIAETRAPLNEPDPLCSTHSIVTFVFPFPDIARHVVVMPGFNEHEPATNVMARIAGTNVCHASYRYRNDVRTTYSFAPDMPLASWDSDDEAEIKAFRAFLSDHPPLPDPNHREHFVSRRGSGRADDVASFVSLPNAPDESSAYKRSNVARGWIDLHAFSSVRMGNNRRVWVYTPPGYKDETRSYPVLVAFDGGGALSDVPVQRILDNLLADGRIGPAIAVLIDNPTDTSRNDELPCNENFACFIEEELLPWLAKNYRVSREAADRYVTGMSYGGLAAMWMGFRLPHIFGNVIAQAPSLWWGPGYRMDVPRSAGGYEPEWLIAQYEKSPRLPVRFWMEIRLMEPLSLMLESNRRMKAVLEAKGYDLIYSEPAGGHDTALWRGTLASALATMLPH
jgi:enterochelin esterase family protein